MLVHPVEVEARVGHRIWLRFSDGVEGEVDLSEHTGRCVFEAWCDRAFFESVRVGEGRAICWGDVLDLCPDALYMRVSGLTPEQYLAGRSLAATST